ncbi:hypothetical protein [Tabrizicola sp. M-4]|uniref:hypothetical protein n=1 Tax=Tabrizicola sp. M-4 TaxID=3055847 RepID=UPI003DA7FD60
MNRRETFTAPLALAALAAAPSIAGASTESEIMRLYAEWKATSAIADKQGITDAEFDAAETHLDGLQARILSIPAKSAQDLAAKVTIVAFYGDINDRSGPSIALWSDLHALVGEVA